MSKPNPKSLQAALAAITANRSEVERNEQKRLALNDEVQKFLAEGDPDDEERLHYISARRTQAEMMPILIERRNSELPELVDNLAAELDQFERALCDAGKAESQALLAKIEEFLKPAMPDFTERNGEVKNRARALAHQCEAVGIPPVHPDVLTARGWVALYANSPTATSSTLDRVQQTLALYEAWLERGGFNPPEVRRFYGLK